VCVCGKDKKEKEIVSVSVCVCELRRLKEKAEMEMRERFHYIFKNTLKIHQLMKEVMRLSLRVETILPQKNSLLKCKR